MYNRITKINELPDVVKNLLIINGLLFLATISLNNIGIDLVKFLGLHQFQSADFKPHQIITHLFMHGSISHLLMNMFALWMFGKILENIWGAKRFLTYYIITGIGAAILHLLVSQYQIIQLSSEYPELFSIALDGLYHKGNSESLKLTQLILTPTVGASGAVFGILLAFGILFPNTQLFLLFPPVPIKAKYFVIFYGLFELYLGIMNNPNDNVAHFAHLGGMLFGYLLLKYWQKNNTQFY